MVSILIVPAYTLPFFFGLAAYIRFAKSPKRLEGVAVAWAVGWATVDVLTLIMNQFARIRLDTLFFASTSALLVSLSLVMLWGRLHNLRDFVRLPILPAELARGVGRALLIVLLAFVALVAYRGLTTPPASTDALVYHMRLPKVAWETGFLPVAPGVGWLELTTAWANLLVAQQIWIYLGAGEFNEILVRPIVPVYTALLLLLVFDDARRWFGLYVGGIAAASLFAINEFASLSTVMWVEVPVALYSYLAVRSVVKNEGGRWRFDAGIFGGMATLAKYNGLILLGSIAFANALNVWGQSAFSKSFSFSRLRSAAACFIVVAATGVLVASPLLLRNLHFFGNPIYPFLIGGINTEQLPYYSADYSSSDYVRFRLHEGIVLVGSIVTSSLSLALLRFRSISHRERMLFLCVLGYFPVFLYPPLGGSHIRYLAPILPAAAILAARQLAWLIFDSTGRNRVLGSSMMIGSGAVAGGFLLVVDVKPEYLLQYVYTFLGLLLVVLTFVAIRSLLGKRADRIALVALTIIILSPGILAVAAERYPPREAAFDVTLVPENRDDFLERRFGDDWRMWRWINSNFPVDERILTFEARLFYIDRHVMHGSDHVLLPTYSMSLDESIEFLRSLDVQYILDSPWSHVPEINRIFIARSSVFSSLGDVSRFEVVHSEGQTMLYRLAP